MCACNCAGDFSSRPRISVCSWRGASAHLHFELVDGAGSEFQVARCESQCGRADPVQALHDTAVLGEALALTLVRVHWPRGHARPRELKVLGALDDTNDDRI